MIRDSASHFPELAHWRSHNSVADKPLVIAVDEDAGDAACPAVEVITLPLVTLDRQASVRALALYKPALTYEQISEVTGQAPVQIPYSFALGIRTYAAARQSQALSGELCDALA
jgi:hypothetical protein